MPGVTKRIRELGYDGFFARRYRSGHPLEHTPCAASNNHPRLNASGISAFDRSAKWLVRLNAPLEWDAKLLEEQTASPRELEYIGSAHKLGLSGGLSVAMRMAERVTYVWEIARTAPAECALDYESKAAICGHLFLVSCMLQSNSSPKHDVSQGTHLTPREIEILEWCKEGKTYADIASILGISSKTIDYHMSKIMRKLGVHDKVAAIIAATRTGLIDL